MTKSSEDGIISSIQGNMETKMGPMKIYMWLFIIIVVVCLIKSSSNRPVSQPIGQYYY